ncbi:kelch-like protein 10 [Pempheris klunzingeri]|uniref:kelch-like protein 10 n=1 Tax=Pempheris klunzingeri TaxID=3127111 RepID=UPI0039817763
MSDMASAVFNELRVERKLCDVVVKVGDVEFEAHKIILCSCSLYFRTLFTGVWSTSKKQIYTIPGVSPEIMHHIINYAYTNSVPLTEANVVEVLAAADQFMVPGILQTCCFFLEDQMCVTNCIGIFRLVDFYHCPDLKRKVFFYILNNFEEMVCVSHEFLQLSVEQLASIIENDHLSVKRENTVFEGILHWINHQPDQRRGHISVLLPKVRLGLMTADCLKNMINNAVVKESIECVPIIKAAVMAFVDRASGCSKYVYNNLLSRPRFPSAILLVTGGNNGRTAVTSLEVYDARTDCWATVSTEGIPRSHHGSAVLNNFVYLIGGRCRVANLNTVHRFDLVTCSWHQVASMNCCRCYVSIAVHNGCIYAMGGYDRQSYYKTVECYKPQTNRWTIMAPMRSKRCAASGATLNGKVYICGGYNGHRSLSSAECFDPDMNQWNIIAPMRYSRSGLGVAACRGHLYAGASRKSIANAVSTSEPVVGGIISGNSNCCIAEAYDPQTNTWTSVPSMYTPRSYFGIEVVDDLLVVVGGYDNANMSSVEFYDEEAGMWCSASCIKMPRSGLSCSVLHGLNSVVENLFPRGSVAFPNEEKAAGGSIRT